MYPHLDYVKDLRHASNLTSPAQLFPLARAKQRKIIIHAGPTNSGKTYHAFQRFVYLNSPLSNRMFNKIVFLQEYCTLMNEENKILNYLYLWF